MTIILHTEQEESTGGTIVNPWRACTAAACVYLCVCLLPFKLSLRLSVRSTNDTTRQITSIIDYRFLTI